MLPGIFPDKATFDVSFTDEAAVQCDISVIKTPL